MLSLSQNTDTGDHRLPKVPQDNGFSDDPPTAYTGDICLKSSNGLFMI